MITFYNGTYFKKKPTWIKIAITKHVKLLPFIFIVYTPCEYILFLKKEYL